MQYFLLGAKLGEVYSLVLSAEVLASGTLGEAKHDLALSAYHDAGPAGTKEMQLKKAI
jgi:hypothetical protein